MKKKNGFTLVELLAVIVILAVVMLIGGTTVLPMMQKAQKSTLGEEGLSMMDAAEKVFTTEVMKQAGRAYKSNDAVCYSLEYLCSTGAFDKGCKDKNDNYTGSVLVVPKSNGKYEFTFWVSNGTYVFNAANKDTYGNLDDKGILYSGAAASENCGKDLPSDTPKEVENHNDSVLSSLGVTEIVSCTENCSGTIIATGYSVPSGAKYTTASGTTYSDNQTLPKNYEPQTGDVYEDSDYIYKYNGYYYYYDNVWKTSNINGWGVRVKNTTKTSYIPLKQSINGKPLKSLYGAFKGCSNMTVAPEIPNGVTDMWGAFGNCSKLLEAPYLPDSVTVIQHTFLGCSSMKTAPAIPPKVTTLFDTFCGCSSLETAPVIPAKVTGLHYAFDGCTSLKGTVVVNGNVDGVLDAFDGVARDSAHTITITGDAPLSVKEALKATAYNGGQNVIIK